MSSERTSPWRVTSCISALGVLGLIVAGLPLLFLLDCSQGKNDEVLRVTSPDSALDAVVIWNYGGGAAGWSDLFVYLTTAGDSASGAPVLWTDGPEPEIRWVEPGLVEVEAKDFVRKFHNFWVSPRGDTIEIRLRARLVSAMEAR